MRIDRELAYNAERSVLGALLLSPAAVEHMRRLTPDDFIHPTNAKVYRAMLELCEAGTPIDLVTVHDALTASGVEVSGRGLDYLVELGNAVPSAANIEHYITIVAQNGREHRMNEAMSRIIIGEEPGLPRIEQMVAAEKAAMKPVGDAHEPMRMIVEYMDSLVDAPATTLFTTGLPRLDNDMGGLPRGSVSAIAARTRMGKTSLALNIALHNIDRSYRGAFFSLEMPRRQIMDRVSAMRARVSYTAIHKRSLKLEEAAAICDELPNLGDRLHIIDNVHALSGIIEEIDRIRPDIAFIDYIQRVRADRQTESRHHDIESILYRLKEAAIRYDCHICNLSQINRAGTEKPRLEHLKESGALEEASDIIAILHRDYGSDGRTPGQKGVLMIEKHKYGQTGYIDINFDGKYQLFTEAYGG